MYARGSLSVSFPHLDHETPPRVGTSWLGPLITKYLSLLNSHQCCGYLTNAPGVNLLLV